MTDWDIRGCLEYNPQPDFSVEDIEEVLATVEGERDESEWFWLLKLTNNRYAYLQGGCDYTGWDCQSWAHSVIAEDPYAVLGEAASMKTDEWRAEETERAQRALLAQLTTHNLKTVRERIGEALRREATATPKRRLIRTPRRRF